VAVSTGDDWIRRRWGVPFVESGNGVPFVFRDWKTPRRKAMLALTTLISRLRTAARPVETPATVDLPALSTILDHLPIALLLVDRNGQVEQVNEAAAQFADQDKTGLRGLRLGDTLRCLNSLDDPQGCGFGPLCEMCPVQRLLQDTFATSRSHYSVDVKLASNRLGEQCEMDLLVTTIPLRVSGNPMVLISLEDASGRKRAEEALRRERDLLAHIMETSPAGIVMAELDGRFMFANSRAEQILALSRDEIAERTYNAPEWRITDCDGRPFAEAQLPFPQVMATHQPVYDVCYAIVRSDGQRVFLSVNGAPLFDDSGRMDGVVLAMEDITGRKQMEQQLRQAQKMGAVGQLAGGIAHDFNNLLTTIIGYADLGTTAPQLDESTRQAFTEIRQAADRAATLTRQLLAFSRRQPLSPRVININDILLNMDRMLRPLIGENIELLTLPAENLWATRVDPGQLEQVIINLVVNARDAMPRGGKLTLETANVHLDADYARFHAGVTPGDQVMLAVSDTGIGMTDEVKAHLFEPFFTTKERGKGTGLGLATCYGIVQQNGGHIWAYSELERGTTFKIYLPRVEGPPSALPPHIENSHMPRGNETILLVEDDPSVRSLATHILCNQGYAVLRAADGEEALRLVQDAGVAIHLLVSDLVMPHVGGKVLAERLSAIQPDLKVLFTSGYTDNVIVRNGVLDRGIAFLQKPFTPAALARKVREVLDTS